MQFQGGKARQAKAIGAYLRTVDRPCYLEPFVGAGWVLAEVASHFPTVIAGDIHQDLILMHRALQNGWVPPTLISEDDWGTARYAEPSPHRGYVGYQCSWGGKWFRGYARNGYASLYGNYANRGIAGTLRVANACKAASYAWADYRAFRPNHNWIVYCDPPYLGTEPISHRRFDTPAFWRLMDAWSDLGATVLVSEQQAPDGWQPVLTQDRQTTLGVYNDKRLHSDILFAKAGA